MNRASCAYAAVSGSPRTTDRWKEPPVDRLLSGAGLGSVTHAYALMEDCSLIHCTTLSSGNRNVVPIRMCGGPFPRLTSSRSVCSGMPVSRGELPRLQQTWHFVSLLTRASPDLGMPFKGGATRLTPCSRLESPPSPGCRSLPRAFASLGEIARVWAGKSPHRVSPWRAKSLCTKRIG
jgi:hypothetical protein